MTDLFTAVNYLIDKAPARIELLGDKTKKPEPAQHIIEFPGGAIEVSRTTDGDYWAHIIINRSWALDGQRGLHAKIGEVIGTRVTRLDDRLEPVVDIARQCEVVQIAVLVRPVGGKPA